MSIFSSIANAAHTFIAWFEKNVTTIEGAAPTIETSIENGCKYAITVLKIVLSQVTAGSPAAAIINIAIQDLTVISAVAYDAGAHPTLGSLFNDVVTNLGGLEQATGIKNQNTIALVAKVISTIAAIAQAVLAIVPAVA